MESVVLTLTSALVVVCLSVLAISGVFVYRSSWTANRVAGLTYTHAENMVRTLMEERRWAASNSVEARLADASDRAAMTFAEHAERSAERMLQLTEDGREVLKLRQELKIAETNLENARHNHDLAMRALASGEHRVEEQPPEPNVTSPRDGEVVADFSTRRATASVQEV